MHILSPLQSKKKLFYFSKENKLMTSLIHHVYRQVYVIFII